VAKPICIFCGGGHTTLEHLFPDWINDEFPAAQPVSMTLSRRDGTEIRKPVYQPAPIQFRVVCRECNNVWMSEVEARAKPVLLDLIRGRRRQLDVNTQLDLGTWATMKAYVRVGGSGPEVSDRKSRRLLMEQRRPSANVRVLLGYYGSHPTFFGCYHHFVVLDPSETGVLVPQGSPPPSSSDTASSR
jgi:hypothetical protein